MLKARIVKLLQHREFISVATCDFSGRPNAAPKFLLKQDGDVLYLVDYTIGRTWENLKINPKASLSFMDPDTLLCYQINGHVELIEDGDEHKKITDELARKKVDLSTRRIIEGVMRGKSHGSYALVLPERAVVIKLNIEELVEIGSQGELKREVLSH